ncbi:hypothetical protein ASZ90_019092 [hydrocarbon metagenome]|uniref:Uncharacterized protein n=1 Tax=hydrocarbon metagenome TaxID=938273 RepID=A0A0W8E4G0_9ZZZZ
MLAGNIFTYLFPQLNKPVPDHKGHKIIPVLIICTNKKQRKG